MRRTWLALLCTLAAALPAAARDDDPPDSLYHLQVALTDQAGRTHGLDVYRGHPVLITMFYGSCPAVCPLIIDTLRFTDRELTPAERADVRILMISIDPKRDTVAALHSLAEQRHIDTSRWTLARVDEAGVRTIAALLNVQDRQLPSGEFNHSTVITLLSPRGEIEGFSSQLGGANQELLAKLRQ